MSKNEFINKLCMGLRSISSDEAQKTVLFYSEAIDDRIEDGLSEEEAVEEMGNVEEIILELTGIESENSSSLPHTEKDVFEHKEYIFKPSEIKNIKIIEQSFDVHINQSYDNYIHLICLESKDRYYKITEGETLLIELVRSDNSFDTKREIKELKRMINSINGYSRQGYKEKLRLTLAIPEPEDINLSIITSSGDIVLNLPVLSNLNINSRSGDVEIKGVQTNGNFDISTTSGDIELHAVNVVGELRAKSASGNIELKNTECCKLNLSTTSGDAEAENLGIFEGVIKTTSGDVEIENAQGNTLKISSVSGDINLDGICLTDMIELNTTSNDIECNMNSACHHTKVTTTSGDAELSVVGDRKDYSFEVSTVRGNCNIKESRVIENADTISIRTVTGDIDVKFKG